MIEKFEKIASRYPNAFANLERKFFKDLKKAVEIALSKSKEIKTATISLKTLLPRQKY